MLTDPLFAHRAACCVTSPRKRLTIKERAGDLSASSVHAVSSRMSFPWTFSSPPFHYMLRASGQSEVWSDAQPEDKFHQYGWRCGTSEDGYGTGTLIGNWVEQQKDITQYRKARPLPSQFSHYFDSTYSSSFNREEKRPIYSLRKESKSFPGHQLELDLPPTTPATGGTTPTPVTHHTLSGTVKLQDARVQQENTAGGAASF
ncbi:cilia- and flagella-associated protein 68 isoform 3-T3 [Salvelinus alpinus]